MCRWRFIGKSWPRWVVTLVAAGSFFLGANRSAAADIPQNVQRLVLLNKARNSYHRSHKLQTDQQIQTQVMQKLERIRISQQRHVNHVAAYHPQRLSKGLFSNRQAASPLALHPFNSALRDTTPLNLLVNGLVADTVTVGSQLTFTWNQSAGDTTWLFIYYDTNHDGFLDENDLYLDQIDHRFVDNDPKDQNPNVGEYTLLWGEPDGLPAQALNRLLGDLWFVLVNQDDIASMVSVSFLPEPGADFSISGTVTDDMGDPLENVVVWAAVVDSSSDGMPEVVALTDSMGFYQLWVQGYADYQVHSFDYLHLYDFLLPDPDQYLFYVDSDQTDVDFVFAAGSLSLSGIVLDEDNNPVEGVLVGLESPDWVDGTLIAETNVDGLFEFMVHPGHYQLSLAAETLLPDFMVPMPMDVEVNGPTYVTFPVVSTNTTIAGHVYLDGMPLDFAEVAGWNSLGFSRTSTTSDGSYVLPVSDLAPDGFYLDVKYPWAHYVITSPHFDIPAGAQDVDLYLVTADALLWGYFYNADPDNYGEVLYDDVWMVARSLDDSTQVYFSWPTQDDGAYLRWLPAGDYEVHAEGYGFMPTPPETVSVASDSALQVDFYMTPWNFTGGVEGFVLDANTYASIPGAWLVVDGPQYHVEGPADDNGWYHFDLPNGHYWITASASGYEDGYIDIEVMDNVVQNDIHLVPLPVVGTLSGTTYSRSSGGNTTILPYVGIHIYNDEWDFHIGSDANGYYSIQLPGGTFNIEAWAPGHLPLFIDGYDMQPGDHTLDLYLDEFTPTSAIHGFVFDSQTGDPLPDAHIAAVMDPDTDNPIPFPAEVDSNGGYWVDLPNGMFGLYAEADGYAPVWIDSIFLEDDTLDIPLALMPYQGAIMGTVYDDQGYPIPFAWVAAWQPADTTIWFYTEADENGEYYMGVINGVYNVVAGADGFNPQEIDNITVQDNEVTLDFYLEPFMPAVWPPEFTFIIDQPHDQGRWVRTQFFAGGTEMGPFSGFSIWRQIPPDMCPDCWDFITYVPFHADSLYNYVAPTLVDSNAYTAQTGNYWSTFRVTGHLGEWMFVDGPPMSGYSVDNIAPGVPPGLMVLQSSPAGVELQWGPSQDDDFQFFQVYRSTTGDVTNVPPYANVVDNHFVDNNVQAGQTYYYAVKAVDANGNQSDFSQVVNTTVVSVDNHQIPDHYALENAYPNPFNPSTVIRFALPEDADVTLVIYNMLGQKVRTLVQNHLQAGYQSVVWDGKADNGRQLGSGVYVYRLQAGNFQAAHKVVLLR